MTCLLAAAARLVRHSDGFRWVVDRCPYCGRRHTHGGGPLDGDPRAGLGPRAPHCHAGPEYALVEAVGDRRELRAAAPRAGKSKVSSVNQPEGEPQ